MIEPRKNRHERRKAKRSNTAQVEKQATAYAAALVERMAWIIFGKYPDPPEWEKPLIQTMMQSAMAGDDAAFAWLQKRFPPQAEGEKMH